MKNKLFGKKLVLPEFKRPDVPPSSAQYNRAFRQATWDWENEVLGLVKFESGEDRRCFFSYATGRTENWAAIHKGDFVAAVQLDELYGRIASGWRLIDIPLNHREEVLRATQKPVRRYEVQAEGIPYANSVDRALKLGELMSKNYIEDGVRIN